MENGPFEDVFPKENGDIPASYVSLREGKSDQWPPATDECYVLPHRRNFVLEIKGVQAAGTFEFASEIFDLQN